MVDLKGPRNEADGVEVWYRCWLDLWSVLLGPLQESLRFDLLEFENHRKPHYIPFVTELTVLDPSLPES